MIRISDFSSFKELFLTIDGLNNISNEIDFSIFKKYTCKANCALCYLKNDWISEERFGTIVPSSTPNLDRLQYIFSFFESVSIIDDLHNLQHNHPTLYQWYEQNSHLFHLSSMSDTATFQQVKMVQQLRFRGIKEITLSDTFINHVNTVKLRNVLYLLHKHAPIQQIKIIITSDKIEERVLSSITNWAESNGVKTYGHTNFWTDSYSNAAASQLQSIDFIETAHEGGEVFPILSELLYVQHDTFFSTLKHATNELYEPFETIHTFDPNTFLIKVLQDKKKTYEEFNTLMKNHTSPHYEYFKYIANHLTIHSDYNFIPVVLLKPYFNFYKQLTKTGEWVDTKYGLLRTTTTDNTIVPIVSFTQD